MMIGKKMEGRKATATHSVNHHASYFFLPKQNVKTIEYFEFEIFEN